MKQINWTKIVTLLTVIIVGVVCGNILFSQTVQKGTIETKENIKWNKIMAEAANKKKINLVVDGKKINLEKGNLYISDNMELMICVDVIVDLFNCAKNVYTDNSILIEKGSSTAKLKVNSKEVLFNDVEYELNQEVCEKNSKYYVPASIFSAYFGYEYLWQSDTNTAKLSNSSTENGYLPIRYSYVDRKKAPKVKDQGNFGTCWAFATLTALESTLMPTECYDFSEDNLIRNNLLSEDIQDGGDHIMSMAYLMSWKGPVLETEDSYGDGITNVNATVTKHVQEARIIESKDYEQIKEMIYKYGGVESSFYMSMNNSKSKSANYNESKFAYCYKGNNNPNHDVVIIGWDDEFSKENFNDNTISKDGAFICQNSWGDNFGDNGVFYVSYEDSCIGTNNVCYTVVENVDNYDNIYQSDLCGWTGTMGFEKKNSAYFANVFEAKENEMLRAVGFYSATDNLTYEVFVCDSFTNTQSLNDRNHCAAKGTLKNKGYYTINLDKGYNVSKGRNTL